MPFRLDEIVPWGRSFDEYAAMFALTGADLNGRVLGAADGSASFNAEMRSAGRRVISVDPLYGLAATEIRGRISGAYTEIMNQLRRNMDGFVWERYHSPEELGAHRLATMELFLQDYDPGRDEGRYVPGSVDDLPFDGKSFDLALCSHLLFLYDEKLTAAFHDRAMLEMLRVAGEVRIFPLQTLSGRRSPHLESVMRQLQEAGRRFEIRKVDYEFQRGGNEMLMIW